MLNSSFIDSSSLQLFFTFCSISSCFSSLWPFTRFRTFSTMLRRKVLCSCCWFACWVCFSLMKSSWWKLDSSWDFWSSFIELSRFISRVSCFRAQRADAVRDAKAAWEDSDCFCGYAEEYSDFCCPAVDFETFFTSRFLTLGSNLKGYFKVII